jgi:hypothetical protein
MNVLTPHRRMCIEQLLRGRKRVLLEGVAVRDSRPFDERYAGENLGVGDMGDESVAIASTGLRVLEAERDLVELRAIEAALEATGRRNARRVRRLRRGHCVRALAGAADRHALPAPPVAARASLWVSAGRNALKTEGRARGVAFCCGSSPASSPSQCVTTTGTLVETSTFCVSLPSRRRAMPLRPCEPMTMPSQPYFFTAFTMASAG